MCYWRRVFIIKEASSLVRDFGRIKENSSLDMRYLRKAICLGVARFHPGRLSFFSLFKSAIKRVTAYDLLGNTRESSPINRSEQELLIENDPGCLRRIPPEVPRAGYCRAWSFPRRSRTTPPLAQSTWKGVAIARIPVRASIHRWYSRDSTPGGHSSPELRLCVLRFQHG